MLGDEKHTSTDDVIQAQQQARSQALKRKLVVAAVLLVVVALAFIFLGGLSEDKSGANGNNDTELGLAAQDPAQVSAAQESARESFKALLTDYEANTAPILSEMSQSDWGQAELEQFSVQKERSLSLFANAEFVQATNLLQNTQDSALKHINNWRAAYDAKLNQATEYYRSQDIQKARLALAQADKIIFDTDQSRVLRAQLAAYDRVQVYLSQLAVAKVENDLEEQVAIMQQVLKADPTRNSIREALDKSLIELKQNRLSFALSAAQSAFDQGNTSEARAYIQQAEKINPRAKGIPALKTVLNKMVTGQSLQGMKSEIEALKKTDNWQQVLGITQRGLSRFSTDADLLSAQKQASDVLSSMRKLNQFIARSERLSDENIRAAAQNAIADSITMLPLSRSLAAKAQTLAGYIDQYGSKVAITVISDGKTDISVLGTGIVGKTKQKVIELSPGTYVLEGKRVGYRSKRLELSVSLDKPFSVELVCDEKI